MDNTSRRILQGMEFLLSDLLISDDMEVFIRRDCRSECFAYRGPKNEIFKPWVTGWLNKSCDYCDVGESDKPWAEGRVVNLDIPLEFKAYLFNINPLPRSLVKGKLKPSFKPNCTSPAYAIQRINTVLEHCNNRHTGLTTKRRVYNIIKARDSQQGIHGFDIARYFDGYINKSAISKSIQKLKEQGLISLVCVSGQKKYYRMTSVEYPKLLT